MAINYDTLLAYINGLHADGTLSDADFNQIILYILANGNLENSPRDLIQIRRGNVANLPNLAQGELGFCLDSETLFVGGMNGNVEIGNVSIITSKSFGAKGNGVTDDTEALQNAINASEGKILIIPKTDNYYLITAELTGVSNIIILSNGATIKSGTTRIANSYISFENKTNILVRGLNFDMNQPNLPVYTVDDYNSTEHQFNIALTFVNCSNVNVERCSFTNLYNRSIWAYQCTGKIAIKDSDFSSPVQAQKLLADHIGIGSSTGTIEICNNTINNAPYSNQDYGVAGIFMHNIGGKLTVCGNYMNYIGRNNAGGHRLGAIDFYQDVKNASVYDNVIENLMGDALRMSQGQNIDFYGNKITINTPSDEPIILFGAPFAVAGQEMKNIFIHDNIVVTDKPLSYGIGGQVDLFEKTYTNIKIFNNLLIGFRIAIKHSGICDGYEIYNNRIIGIPTSIGIMFEKYASSSANLAETATKITDVRIYNNTIENVGTGIDINWNGYTGTLDSVYSINNNQITTTTGGIGIITNGLVAKCESNIIKNAALGLYIRGIAIPVVYLFQNIMYNVTTAMDCADVTTVVKANNYNNTIAV